MAAGGEPDDASGRLSSRLAAARLVLILEAGWRALWPLAGVSGLFLAVAWSGLFGHLTAGPHLLLLGLFALAGLAALRPLRALRHLPSATAAARRMEQAAGLAHRPLATLDDQLDLGGDDPFARRLWAAHIAAAARTAETARLPRPAPALAERDPHALRFGVVLLMALSAFAAGPSVLDRTLRAFTLAVPDGTAGAGANGPAYVAWITPPAYTGKPPVYLGADGARPGERLMVPKGSKIVAQISRVDRGAIGFDGKTIALAPVEADSVSGEATITAGDHLALLKGDSEIAAWPLTVVPDAPPTAFFIGLPETTTHQALKISYRAADDYGLTGIALRLTLTEPGAEPRPPHLIPLQSATGQTAVKGAAFKDLAADSWAGLAVKAEIVATDTAGQTGASPPLALTLPERKFTNPVARALIAERRQLIAHPDQRRAVIDRLAEMASDTDSYNNRTAIYLGFSVAIAHIARHTGPDMAETTAAILWDMALDLEDGQVANARDALRAAQDAVQDALRNGASDAEIDRLMADLRQAMNDYLKAMAQDAARHGGAPPGGTSPDGRMISSDALRTMLDQVQRMAQGGSREQAAEMLSRLQQTLENHQSMQARGRPGSPAAAMGKSLDDLQRMVGRQRDLRDQSFSAAQGQQDGLGEEDGQMPPLTGGQGQGAAPGAPGTSLGEQARQQEALRRALGDLMRLLSDAGIDPSGPLGQAERAMNDARQSLDAGDAASAADAQGEALGALRDGMRALGEDLAQELGVERGNGQGQANGLPGEGQVDPLGRPRPGREFGTGDDTHIPTTFEVKGVQAVLDELRRRAGERGRPQEERDYIERLLKRF